MIVDYYPGWAWSFSWLFYVGFIFSFLVAFGIGANDCANSYATVVGAKVLKLWQAYILATIFEILGAGLLGYAVITTLTKNVVDVHMYTVRSASLNSTDHIPCDNLTDPGNCTLYTEVGFAVGELSSLISTAVWLIFASIMKMPVSSTQATIGATIGFSLVLKGRRGIQWGSIGNIAISWVTSPLLSGAIAIAFYSVFKYTVLKRLTLCEDIDYPICGNFMFYFHLRMFYAWFIVYQLFSYYTQDDQFEASLTMMPIFYWFALTVNVFAVIYEGSSYLGFDRLAWYSCLGISLGIGCTVAIFLWFVGRKWVRKRVLALQEKNQLAEQIRAAEKIKSNNATKGVENGTQNGVTEKIQLQQLHIDDNKSNQLDPSTKSSSSSLVSKLKNCIWTFRKPVPEDPLAVEVFHYLQILSACFLSFGHGSHDTANSVKALIGIWFIFMDGYVGGVAAEDGKSLELLSIFGAVSMVVGLWILGHRVIQTMGKEITEITAVSGFCMELGAAFTVLFASKMGIPISSTECAVGAIVAVGWFKSETGGIQWKLMKNIALAWLITMPLCGGFSALLTYLINFAFM